MYTILLVLLVLLLLGLILNIAARTLVYGTTQRRFAKAK